MRIIDQMSSARFARIIALCAVTSCIAAAALGASFIVPTDRDLVAISKGIVIATAVGTFPVHTRDGCIDTVVQLKIEEVIKGNFRADSPLEIVEGGGALDGRYEIVPEAPRYRVGERALIFLDTNKRGEYCTYGMILGKFNFVRDLHGQQLLLRGADDGEIFGWNQAGERHVEPIRSESAFLTFVRASVCNLPAPENYLASDVHLSPSLHPKPSVNAQGFHAADYQDMAFGAGGCESGCGIRWQTIFDFPGGAGLVTFHVNGTETGIADAMGGIDRAMAAWINDPKSNVNYVRGTSDSTPFSPGDGISSIHLDDSADVPNGAVGFTRYGGGATYTFDGGTMSATTDADVAIKANFTTNQTLFEEIVTHELGHSLSFRHSGDRAPSTSQAVMNFQSFGSFGASLQSWDTDAVETVYNLSPGGVCNAPQVTVQPLASQSIPSGSQANLSVTASGTATLTYQWYVGNSGNTSSPVGGATSTTFHPTPPIGTTNYWVRVSNFCSGTHTDDSRTAVVTVTCTAPSVAAPIANPTSISSGQSSVLTASPTGSAPFTYQWYTGSSGVTTSPIGGATNSTVTVSPTVTTSYWVRVTGQCAPAADSPSTSVTVTPCVPPSATTPNPSPASIPNGQSSTIFETANGTGPLTYQWYTGTSPNTASPIGGATSSFVTVSPTVTTSYWVRVTGQCAPPADSPTATVTVTCSPISAQGVNAQPSTISQGQSSNLFFTTNGTGPFSIQWYTGSQGDTSNPIVGATSTSTIVSPTATTAYWVRVSAPCGTQDGGVLVMVSGTICTAPSITTQPASTAVNSGSQVTLTVVAAGTPTLTYQWYIGEKGDVTHPVAGATLPSLTQSPSATTKYWARVSNSCNGTQSADSNAATVTVASICANPAITTQPANVSAPIGTAATMVVVAGGTAPLHYQWFEGVKGDTSKPRGTDSATFVTGAVSVTKSYWVHVTNTCGGPAADSNAAIVTAIAPPRRRAVRH